MVNQSHAQPARQEVHEEFETFLSKVLSLYASHPPDTTTSYTHTPPLRDNGYATHIPPKNNLIEDQDRIRSYKVTGSLNHDISNLIFNTIHPVIEM